MTWKYLKLLILLRYFAVDQLSERVLYTGRCFPCTTGAEALYSTLGTAASGISGTAWIFVKSCLILNYLGQGAWLLANYEHQEISAAMITAGFNPFYGVMPGWFPLFRYYHCYHGRDHREPGPDLRVLYPDQRSDAP